jgi:hypothetical protein
MTLILILGIFGILLIVLFKTGLHQINILASATHGRQDHSSPEKPGRRNKGKSKRQEVTQHAVANHQRNIENPDR